MKLRQFMLIGLLVLGLQSPLRLTASAAVKSPQAKPTAKKKKGKIKPKGYIPDRKASVTKGAKGKTLSSRKKRNA